MCIIGKVAWSARLGASSGCFAIGLMERLLNSDAEQLVIWFAVLATLLAVGVYVVRRVRAAPAQREPSASELLSKCRESHSRGELTDEEFRTIKTTLERRLQEELNGEGQTG